MLILRTPASLLTVSQAGALRASESVSDLHKITQREPSLQGLGTHAFLTLPVTGYRTLKSTHKFTPVLLPESAQLTPRLGCLGGMSLLPC